MAEKNSTIIEKVWLSGTNDFQQRIPDPTQHGIDATVDAILDPMNKAYFNQFLDILVMRIGETYVHNMSWENPLAIFKKSRLMYGSTIQEIIPKWIKAHSYVDDAEDVFKLSRPDVAQWFHSQNRMDRYDISVVRDELRTAFTEEGGLNRLVAAILEVPRNSDNYDEYQIMKQLIAVYEQKWGHFKVQVSAPTNQQTAQALLKQLRVYRRKLTFPTTIYNSGQIEDVPVFCKPSELVLFITPEVEASIDVDALAVLFHMEKADVQQRIVVLDEFPIAGAQALLTTDDYFMCKDTEYTIESIHNPKSLGENYFLHHWGVYSISPFVPAILFTTAEGTSVPTVTQALTAITASIADSTPAPGDITQVSIALTGTLTTGVNTSYTGDAIELAPEAAIYDVSVTRSTTVGTGNDAVTTTEAINSPRTYIDRYGKLHVGEELQNGDVITVVATSTYINPSGSTTTLSDDVTATVTVS